MGERSLNPRPYKAKHNSNARVEHAREEETRITTEREGRKEGKKERKKERKGAPVRRLVRARNINFYEERLGFYVRREAGLEKVLWTVRSLQNNFFAFFSNVLEKVGREDNEIKTSEIFLRLLLLLLLLLR